MSNRLTAQTVPQDGAPVHPNPPLGTYHCIGVLDQFVLRHVVYLFRLLQQIPQEVLQSRGREGIEKIKEVKASGESLVPQYRIGKEIMLIDVARGFFLFSFVRLLPLWVTMLQKDATGGRCSWLRWKLIKTMLRATLNVLTRDKHWHEHEQSLYGTGSKLCF